MSLCGNVDAAGIRMPLHGFAGTIRRNKHRDDRAHGRLQNPLAQNDVRAGEPSRRWEARWNKWKGQALFEGRAGQIQYHEFVTRLTGDAANLELADFLTAGIQDMVLFKYLTEGVRNSNASGNRSTGAEPKYEPGLAVGVNETNVERAKQRPIPTRHAVAHGLVAYSSQQSSLNAIFIADYVFSVVSRALRNKPEVDASNCLPNAEPDSP